MSPLLHFFTAPLVLIISPMAEGVGVTGGGFVVVFPTFRLLFGVVGGGAMASLPPSITATVASRAKALLVMFSVALPLRLRFFVVGLVALVA